MRDYLHPRANFYRDVWLLAVTAVVLLGLKALSNQNDEIQAGRQATTGITCAVSAAVVKGGKITIVSSAEAPLPPRLEAFLQRYGYPPRAERQKQAEAAGNAYTNLINREILRVVGVRASKVLEPEKLPNGKPNPDAGSLNCERLRAFAKLK